MLKVILETSYLLILLWALVGNILFIWYTIRVHEEILVKDIFACLFLGTLAGPMVLLFIIIDSVSFNKCIWKK